jgi:hypothetical protein
MKTKTTTMSEQFRIVNRGNIDTSNTHTHDHSLSRLSTNTSMKSGFVNKRLRKRKGAIKNGQSGDTGNIGYTRHRKKTNKTQRNNAV